MTLGRRAAPARRRPGCAGPPGCRQLVLAYRRRSDPVGRRTGAGDAPATTAITDALPRELQNVGSAVNDLARELGGALGIAVLGSILTATYRDNLHLTGVPSRVAEAAHSSLAGAAAGGPVLHQAQEAFITGLHAALLGGAITAVATAIAVAALLRRRHSPGAPTSCPAPADPMTHSGQEATAAAEPGPSATSAWRSHGYR